MTSGNVCFVETLKRDGNDSFREKFTVEIGSQLDVILIKQMYKVLENKNLIYFTTVECQNFKTIENRGQEK